MDQNNSIYNLPEMTATRRDLRQQMTATEVILWQRLRDRQVAALRFRRQYSVGRYVLDFYCPSAKLAIEVDGQSHDHELTAQRDQERQRHIESLGIRMLRFTDQQVRHQIKEVLEMIAQSPEERTSPLPPPEYRRGRRLRVS